jgi:hypothetical protein
VLPRIQLCRATCVNKFGNPKALLYKNGLPEHRLYGADMSELCPAAPRHHYVRTLRHSCQSDNACRTIPATSRGAAVTHGCANSSTSGLVQVCRCIVPEMSEVSLCPSCIKRRGPHCLYVCVRPGGKIAHVLSKALEQLSLRALRRFRLL